MDVKDQAASGPADTAESNTGEVKGGGIDGALEQALADFDDGSSSPAEPVKVAEKVKAAPADADTTAAKGSPKTNAATDAAPTALEAPKHWDDESKAAFATLTPEAKKLLLDRSKSLEGGYTKRSMEMSDRVKYADAISSVLSDDRTKAQLSQAGMDEVGYVRYLHSLQNFATAEPARYVAWAMQNLGVTPQSLGLAPAGQQQAQPHQQAGTGDPRLDELLMDPNVRSLQEQFGKTNEQLQQMQAWIQAQEHQRQQYARSQTQAAQSQLANMWGTFRSQLDDTGQLAHPHADKLMQQMGAIMETNPEIASLRDGPEKLAAAYEAAIWANPALRTSRIEAEKAAATKAAAAAAEAERAKRAAGVKRAVGAPTVKSKKSGLDGALESALASLGNS